MGQFDFTPDLTPIKPDDHHTRHEDEGADEISVAALSGLLADDQHVLDTEVVAAVFTGLERITVGTEAPASPSTGDLWVDTG